MWRRAEKWQTPLWAAKACIGRAKATEEQAREGVCIHMKGGKSCPEAMQAYFMCQQLVQGLIAQRAVKRLLQTLYWQTRRQQMHA